MQELDWNCVYLQIQNRKSNIHRKQVRLAGRLIECMGSSEAGKLVASIEGLDRNFLCSMKKSNIRRKQIRLASMHQFVWTARAWLHGRSQGDTYRYVLDIM